MQAYQQESEGQRYMWSLQTHDDLHILVTMLPALAKLIHKANEIVCDFTFKRVAGDINEWEVAIFPPSLQLCQF
jgi:hypothetical protein